MFEELEPIKEISEPVLFHGTTLGRFNLFHGSDGVYRNPNGEPLWMDEENLIPNMLAEEYAKEHADQRIIILARSDKLELSKDTNGNFKTNYWRVPELPSGSYVYYNMDEKPKDYMGGDIKKQIEEMERLCEPLGVLPSYIKVWKNHLNKIK